MQKKLFKAKVMRRRGCGQENFRFNEIASKVMDWNPEQSDVLENIVMDQNLLRCEETGSYRGSKQKSPAFMESMIEICTGKGSAVIDLTAGVGELLSALLQILNPIAVFNLSCYSNSLVSVSLAGSSVAACEDCGRHILALEEDLIAFDVSSYRR